MKDRAFRVIAAAVLVVCLALLVFLWPDLAYTEVQRLYVRQNSWGFDLLHASGEPTGTSGGTYRLRTGKIVGPELFAELESDTLFVLVFEKRWGLLPGAEFRDRVIPHEFEVSPQPSPEPGAPR